MSDTDQNLPIGKPARRNRKGEARRPKSEPPPGMETDQRLSAEPVQPQTAEPDEIEDAPIEAMAASPEATTPEAEAIDPAAAAEAIPRDAAPISLRTIANAYGDYTLKSLDETRSFVERLTGVRSLDKAMEVQREFAKQTYATFVAETQKIGELHGELARQALKPLERLVAKATKAGR
jgi:hypothetical protein